MTGVGNTAAGWYSLFTNTSGSYKTGVGAGTLLFNIGDSKGAGSQNTAIGTAALLFNTAGSGNAAVGVTALLNNTEGGNNTAIGEQALYTNTIGFSNTAIGAFALFGNSADTDRNTATGAEALFSNTRYHKEYDASQTIAFGLIAEEVAEVNPDLVGRNPKGEPESVRYEQINAMLLNEFLKEHRRGEEQDRKIQFIRT
jgi:hypothetical protein